MEIGAELIIAWLGFTMATYSVMANDAPAQVLGTLIASHPDKKRRLWFGCSVLLLIALLTSWFNYDGGIDFGRLNQIDRPKMEWIYLLGPVGLLVLTRLGMPVSTSFMMLSIFSSGIVLEKILTKSAGGYGLAFLVAFTVWYLARSYGEAFLKKPINYKFWRPAQYFTTSLLWWFWLTHDLANISVFLPRSLSVTELVIVCVMMVAALGLIFRDSGGRVHSFVFRDEGENMDMRVATGIDAIYAFLLYFFKEWNDLPMSTTWVFIGLMAGRELGRSIGTKRMRDAKDIILIRLGVLILGAVISLALVQIVLMLR